MGGGDLLYQGQSQAEASGLLAAGGISHVKGVRDPGQVLFRNSPAMVRHREAGAVRQNLNAVPGFGGLGPVLHQVHQGAAKQIFVQEKRFHPVLDFQGYPVFCADLPGEQAHLLQKRWDRGFHQFCVFLQGKQHQQLLHHGFQPVELRIHAVQQGRLLFFREVDGLQGVYIQQQGGQGRFQLMAHGPDEQLLPGVLLLQGSHMVFHRPGHAVEVLRQKAQLIPGADGNPLAVAAPCNALRGPGQFRQGPQRPGDDQANGPQTHQANTRCQQGKPPAQLPEPGMDVVCIPAQVNAAPGLPDIHVLSQNQEMPSLHLGPDGLHPCAGQIQIAFRVDGCGSIQARLPHQQGAAGNAAAAEGIDQLCPLSCRC